MQSFGKFMRNRLPALGLGLVTAFGVTTVIGVTAPAAVAQKKEVKESKEFVEAFQAAQAASSAKDWNTLLAQADTMASTAKTDSGKQAALQFHVVAYASLGKKQELLTSLDQLLAGGSLPPEQVKNFRALQMGTYAEMNNDAKAVELTKAYIKDYGGTSQQLAFIASYSLKQKDYAAAIDYANKAIEQAGKEGQKPKDAWYQIILKAYFDQSDFKNYYITIERAYADYPKPEYIRAIIERAIKEPKFNRDADMLDVYRALDQSKADLKPNELADMGEKAYSRGAPAEAVKAFARADKAGWAGIPDTQAARWKRMYAEAQTAAKADAAGTLAKSATEAAKAAKGDQLVSVGEAYMGMGDYTNAIDNIQKGIAKGGLDDSAAAYANLQLGIAQYKAGQKDDARKTWSAIKSDNGAEVLAKDWILMSRNG